MVKVSQLLVPPELLKNKSEDEILRVLKSGLLNIIPFDCEIYNLAILKKSIDARKKPEVYYSFTLIFEVRNEILFLRKIRSKKFSHYEKKEYVLPENISAGRFTNALRPVVVGFGPAGIGAAYVLAKMGLNPVVIERGKKVDERDRDVKEFWNGKKINPNSNVQFGEGGAGAFSDGKLTCGNKDKDGLKAAILKTLVKFGAPSEIIYDFKPHVGTDILRDVVKNIRDEIKRLGGTFYFETTLTGIEISAGNRICGVEVESLGKKRTIKTDRVFLCIGHSARDTFEMLLRKRIGLLQKPFAVGYRVIHEQDFINYASFGKGWEKKGLPNASYKLTYQTKSGRPVYSFCMCPGGYVVDSSSASGFLCVNGMSYSGRDGKFANSAIVMGVNSSDFPFILDLNDEFFADKRSFILDYNHPLLGMYFQEMIEKKAYEAGGGQIPFCNIGENDLQNYDNMILESAFKGRATPVAGLIRDNLVLPKILNDDFNEAMEGFSVQIPGYSKHAKIAAAVESRTSSPVRILRDEDYEAVGFFGLYPCGEGAGYAGGIMSAAMDGIRAAVSSTHF